MILCFKYIIIVLLTTLLLLFNCIINGYIVKDVSTSNTFYKSYAVDGFDYCVFAIDVLCVPTNPGDDCNSLQHSNLAALYNEYSNGTSYVYSYSINTGNYGSFDILFGQNLAIPDLTVAVQCLVLDMNSLDIQFVGGSYFILPATYGIQIVGEYKLTGVSLDGIAFYRAKVTIDPSLGSQCNAQINSITSTISFVCNSLPPVYDPSLIQINLSSGSSGSKTFTLVPFTKVLENFNVIDYKTYPALEYLQNSNFKLFGYNRLPLLEFKINSTTINKGYYMLNVNGQTVAVQIYPIYTDETSMTILSPLYQISNDLRYEFYYQSEKAINKVTEFQIGVNQYDIPSYPTIQSTNSYLNGLPILSFWFSDSTARIDLPPYSIGYDYLTKTRAPYGYVSGNTKLGYEYHVSILLKSSYQDVSSLNMVLNINANQWSTSTTFQPLDTTFVYDKSLEPSILNSEVFYLDFNTYLYRLQVKSPYGFSCIRDMGSSLVGIESLVSGDLKSGTYEFINFEQFQFVDQVSSKLSKFLNDVLYVKGDTIYRNGQHLKFIPNFNKYSITSVSFLYNNLDVTNHRTFNVFYFNYSDSVPRDTLFSLIPYHDDRDLQDFQNQFVSSWNDSIKLFQIQFFVEANIGIGDYPFALYIKSQQEALFSNSLSVQLKIKKSKMYNQGPIFKVINKIQPSTIDGINNKSSSFGWSFIIQDSSSLFDGGYFVIVGQIDQSIYNITVTSRDIGIDGRLDIKLNISAPCITQNYIINQVYLINKFGKSSYFSIIDDDYESVDVKSVSNPFLYYLNDTTINKIILQCQIPATDSTPPVLLSFGTSISSTREIDVSKTNRPITFNFAAYDPESGLKNHVYPIVYISNSNGQLLQCKSKILEISNTTASYQCSIQLPVGFGYPGLIIYSVYGLINGLGLFRGYSTQILANSGFEAMANTSYSTNEPSLTGNLRYSDRSTSLWLLGKGLGDTSFAYIKYFDNSTSAPIKPSIRYSTAIKLSNIKSTKKPFQVYVQTSPSSSSTTFTSNTLSITPLLFDYYIPDCNNNGIIDESSQQIQCICNSKWTSLSLASQCTVPNHYISTSSKVSAQTGGQISLFGYFGDTHNNQILLIDDKPISTIISTNSDSIIVNIGPGQIGQVKVSYTQNDLTFSGVIYPYLNTEILCSTNCQVNGQCDKSSGTCICKIGFTGFDCLSPIIDNNGTVNNNNTAVTETKVDNNGTVSIKNYDVGFSIFIDSIAEVDINGQQVSIFNLSNNWLFINKIESISTFYQKRINQDQTEATIKLVVEEVTEREKEFSFLGTNFTVSKDGLKLSLSISNWLYSSNLNTLQIEMSSDIHVDTSTNKCNQDGSNALIEASSNNYYLSNNINYLKVTKNSRSLYARFQDKMLADDRPSTVLVQLSNNTNTKVIKVLLNLPRCGECLIDPDFSLLLKSDYKFDCINDSNSKAIIAVAVAVAVGGFIIILVSIYLIYRKSTALKIKVYSLKKSLKRS